MHMGGPLLSVGLEPTDMTQHLVTNLYWIAPSDLLDIQRSSMARTCRFDFFLIHRELRNRFSLYNEG